MNEDLNSAFLHLFTQLFKEEKKHKLEYALDQKNKVGTILNSLLCVIFVPRNLSSIAFIRNV